MLVTHTLIISGSALRVCKDPEVQQQQQGPFLLA